MDLVVVRDALTTVAASSSSRKRSRSAAPIEEACTAQAAGHQPPPPPLVEKEDDTAVLPPAPSDTVRDIHHGTMPCLGLLVSLPPLPRWRTAAATKRRPPNRIHQ